MPRIRTIKPEFWTDEKIVELSPWARLFYIGLWNFADDNGVVEYKPKQLKMRIFPADKVDIESLVSELAKLKLILVYEVEDAQYLQCPNLAKHQVIDKPRKSNLPTPNYDINGNQLISTEIMLGREGKGKGREEEKERKGKKKKTPIPEDFAISENVRKWAVRHGYTNLEAHLESFVNKCLSKGYEYIDHDRAFMNAIVDNWAKIPPNGTGPPQKQKTCINHPKRIATVTFYGQELCDECHAKYALIRQKSMQREATA